MPHGLLNNQTGRAIRIGLFAGLTLLIGAMAGAQCDTSIGAKAGANLGKSKFSGGSTGVTSDDAEHTGLAAGVVVHGECTEHFGVQFEALYVRRETTFFFPPSGGLPGITSLYKVDWIDFPLSAMGLFNSSADRFRPFIFGGIDFAARIRARAESNSGGKTSEVDAKDQVRPTDFSLFGGAGAKFKTGDKWWLTLDGRYIYGLRNISPDTRQSWKNRDWQFLAGFLWEI